MDFWFYPSAITACIVILVPSILNACVRREASLNWRFAAIGFDLVLSVILLCLWHGGFVPRVPLFATAIATLCWLAGFLYFSFLVEMTSVRRVRGFGLLYALPVVLGAVSVSLPASAMQALYVAGGAALILVSIAFIIRWIRASTDEGARRDGEWTMLLFVLAAGGSLAAVPGGVSSLAWVVSIWFLGTHFAINHFNVRQQLTNPENQLVMNNVFDVVLMLDSSGRIGRMNRRGHQLTSFTQSAINGYGIETLLVHPDLVASTRRSWLERYGWLDTGFGSSRSPSIDGFVRTAGNEEIPVDLRIIRLVDGRKNTTGYIVSATDQRITHQLMKEISDREYATRDLALSESKFSRMFIFNPTGILIVDPENLRITDANPAIEEILECDSSVLAGKQLTDLGFEMDGTAFDAVIEKIQMEGSVPEFAMNIRLKDSTVKNCRLSAVSFDLNRTKRMLVSLADVTEQEHLREALERKKKVETIGILAGGIAHDFNNILAVILGHIGLAKMRVVDSHARAPIEKAEQACLRAREITRQLLAFSRGGKPVIGVCDTRQVIVDSAMLAVSDTSVACLFDVSRDIWALMADRIQIGQVISNIVGNAVDAMEKSGIIEISARNQDLANLSAQRRPVGLDMKPLAAGPYVMIRIKDQGPGIPESVLPHIFDPFFTTKEKGTGLGLSIAYSVVQNHNGSIGVESAAGDGTTFVIYLPADTTRSASQEGEGDLSLNGDKKVLLMDDDPLVREAATGMLSSFGYHVVATCDGQEALDVYRASLDAGEPFDFGILDLVIPDGMSGAECVGKILKMNPNAILLVSSGYSDDPVLSQYRDYGFQGIIPKPYTIEELRRVLLDVLVN
jgi:PAS domain S-box-containing protein